MDEVVPNIKEFLDKVHSAFPDYCFDYNKQGCGWARAFILHKGVSLGRFNFKPKGESHTIYGVHWYKPSDYEYDKKDDFFYQIDTWLRTGKVVKFNGEYLVQKAKENKQKHIEEIMEWRNNNPLPIKYDKDGKEIHRHRKHLDTNWMGEFRKLVQIEMEKSLT